MAAGEAQKKWATPQEWEAQRANISRLYKDENRRLTDVIDIMEKEHNFYATTSMYNKRIRKWGLNKKLKADEVLAMLYVKKPRDEAHKASEFRLRGGRINENRINSYLKRKGAVIHRLETGGVPTQAAIAAAANSLRTPSPEPAAGPQLSGPLLVSEQLLTSVMTYISGSFEADTWFLAGNDGDCVSRKSNRGVYIMHRFCRNLGTVAASLTRLEDVEVFKILDPAFRSLEEVVRDEEPRLVVAMIPVLDMMRIWGQQELFNLLLKYLKGLTMRIYGKNHILYKIWDLLLKVDPAGIGDMSDRLFNAIVNSFFGQIGGLNPLLLSMVKDRWYLASDFEAKEDIIERAMVMTPASNPMMQHLQMLQVIARTEAAIGRHEYDGAEEILKDMANFDALGDWAKSWKTVLRGRIKWGLGDLDAAAEHYREAYELAILIPSYVHENWVQYVLLNLGNVLSEAGRLDEAAEVRRERLSRLSQLARHTHDDFDLSGHGLETADLFGCSGGSGAICSREGGRQKRRGPGGRPSGRRKALRGFSLTIRQPVSPELQLSMDPLEQQQQQQPVPGQPIQQQQFVRPLPLQPEPVQQQQLLDESPSPSNTYLTPVASNCSGSTETVMVPVDP